MEYLSCAATAKLIRAALKTKFPGTKFSVRSDVYSGGASIRVKWTDGPCKAAVEAVAKPFGCGGFDGMIDMAYSMNAWLLPDGTAAYGSSSGTEGSRGSCPAFDKPAPVEGAVKVHFGADFIFCDKERSLATFTAVVEKVAADYGVPVPTIVDSQFGGPYISGGGGYVESARCPFNDLVFRELNKENETWRNEQQAKKAAA